MSDRLWVKKVDIERIAREQREAADKAIRNLAILFLCSAIFWTVIGILVWNALSKLGG